MTLSAKGQFTGLMTAVSELNAPPGALRRADNVVIRKPGAIECRQAMAPLTLGYTATGMTFLDATEHAGTVVYRDEDGWRNTVGTLRQYSPQQGSFLETPVPLRGDSFAIAQARGNLYFAHSRGVLRSEVATDPSWLGTGFVALNASMSSIDSIIVGTTLASGWQYAYRVVPIRTDANGMTVRGRPSGAMVVRNTSGSARNPQVYFTVLEGVGYVRADAVEIYRSRAFPNTINIDDEMMLVAVVETPTTGFYDFIDTVPDSQRSAALYTSPSRGGIENANDSPPACGAMELYRGCMFFGNIAGPQRFVVSFDYADCTGSTTGVGLRFGTWNTTNGSAVVTSANPVAGIQPGMVTVHGGLARTVQSVVGTTITFDFPMTATVVGEAFALSDAIEVDGQWNYIFSGATALVAKLSLPGAISNNEHAAYMITPPVTGQLFTAVIEGILPNGPAFEIRGTHGDEMQPPLPLFGATAKTSAVDVYPNGLIYSEPDQPEHVPPKNFMLIGEKSKAILGLAATRDSLFIFKEDGIWRLSGINGQWRVDPFDMTTFCVLPSSIKKMDNRIYMLSNKGVVRVSEQGTELLSAPIADLAAQLVDDCIANHASLGYYKLTGLDGCAAAVDGRNNEYRLLVGYNVLKSGGQELVYNARTNAWTTFSYNIVGTLGFDPSGFGVGLANAPLVLHTAGARIGSYALTGDAVLTSDGTQTFTVTSVTPSGSNYDMAFADSKQAGTGDLIAQGSYIYELGTATFLNMIAIPTGAAVAALGTPPTGVYTHYRAITCTVQPHGFANPVFDGKLWLDLSVAVSRFRGPYKVSIDYTSAEPTLTESLQTIAEVFPLPATNAYWLHYNGTLLRQLVPRAHARSWLLRPTLLWSQAFGEVVLESIAAESRENGITRSQQHSTGEG